MKRVILHIDMDAFYASIEQVDFPEYKNKPVVVGSDPLQGKGRGVVSAASYEARKYGIHSALPISKAYQRCPQAIFVRPRMKRYSQISKIIMEVLYSFSPDLEQISIDEAFLDCTNSLKLFGNPIEIAKMIKKEIYKQTFLTASIGIATNKSIAKIASDMQKPDGITCCPPGKEQDFLADLNISCLWGAGKQTVKLLNKSGFFKVKDIACKTEKELVAILGENGKSLWKLSRGLDHRDVISEKIAQKSIGKEFTFKKDTNDIALIIKHIIEICDIISNELRKYNLLAKTITIKIRLENFKTYNRSYTYISHENNFRIFRDSATNLFKDFDKAGKKIRLIGVSLSNLIRNKYEQLNLFEEIDLHKRYIDKNDKLYDDLKEKYGEKITRATFLS